MRNFDYFNPTRILFGAGQIANLAQLIPSDSRVLITHGGGSILQNGVWQAVEQALNGHQLSRFAGIEANPQYTTLLRATEQARQQHCDFILAVGGGSVIDGSKFIAAALAYPGEPFDLLSGTPIRRALPLGCVPTSAATGSESNCRGVLNHTELQARLSFSATCLHPRFAILDPCTTFSLPRQQTAGGVVTTFAHGLLYYLAHPCDASLRDRQLESLLLTLLDQGPKVLVEPQSYAIRAELMWCASPALNGTLTCAPIADSDLLLLSHELSRLYHLDHAQSLAVLLPAQLSESSTEQQDKLLQYAERVWNLRSGSDQQRVNDAISATEAFFRDMGLGTRLSAHGLDAEVIPQILDQAQRNLPEQPRMLDLQACERLLLRAL